MNDKTDFRQSKKFIFSIISVSVFIVLRELISNVFIFDYSDTEKFGSWQINNVFPPFRGWQAPKKSLVKSSKPFSAQRCNRGQHILGQYPRNALRDAVEVVCLIIGRPVPPKRARVKIPRVCEVVPYRVNWLHIVLDSVLCLLKLVRSERKGWPCTRLLGKLKSLVTGCLPVSAHHFLSHNWSGWDTWASSTLICVNFSRILLTETFRK